jgi:hypothetical protein
MDYLLVVHLHILVVHHHILLVHHHTPSLPMRRPLPLPLDHRHFVLLRQP